MTNKGEIYFCEICGNKVQVLEEGNGTLVCCGQDMILIQWLPKALYLKSLRWLLWNLKGFSLSICNVSFLFSPFPDCRYNIFGYATDNFSAVEASPFYLFNFTWTSILFSPCFIHYNPAILPFSLPLA